MISTDIVASFTNVYFTIGDKKPILYREHLSLSAYSKQLRNIVDLRLPTFLKDANNPAPRPIVPRVPNVSVNLFAPDIIFSKPLIIEITPSEFAIFSIVSVQVFLRRLRLPSQDFAVLSRNIQYHSQHDISC